MLWETCKEDGLLGKSILIIENGKGSESSLLWSYLIDNRI